MPWLILALGLILGMSGAAALIHGYPYMQIEFGWTEVIAGTTALAGGVVTMALGAVLMSLAALRKTLERGQVLAARPADILALRPADTHAQASRPEMPARPPEPVKASVPRPVEVQPPMPARRAATPNVIDMTVPAAAVKPRILRPRAPVSPPSTSDRPTLAVPAPGIPANDLDGDLPTVVGRYESGGSAYALFSDGTIEVKSDTELHKFASMEELKTFMAREDRGPEKVEANC